MKFISLLSIVVFMMPLFLHANNDIEKLIMAMKGKTPIIQDLQQLSDEIGARLTGTKANEESLDWALTKFQQAKVPAKKEIFNMPKAWIEFSAHAVITGKGIRFESNIAAMPFTESTPKKGLSAPIINLKSGGHEEFIKHKNLHGKWLLIETSLLNDEAGIHGLFQEYVDFVGIEDRAEQVNAAGVVYMSSRTKNLMYRHLPSDGADNTLPIVVIEREHALKIQRLISEGHQLNFNAKLNISDNQPYQTHNIVAEIKGSVFPNEIVLIGAHIDSYDLGTGALDNGSNVALVIDIARQIKKLNIQPKRTIRFALFNGEEQGLYGSWGYTKTHLAELPNHVVASTIDIGTGKITGFFTNGREEITATVNTLLQPVKSLGPFTQINVPVVGTDNYDFMMNGVANLVANQADANYASNYHAESDTFDKVDQTQLKLNSAIMAAITLGFANLNEVPWKKQSMSQVEEMVNKLNIEASMKTFGLYKGWKNKTRPLR